MDRIVDLAKYWSESPPLAVCVRAYLGVKEPGEVNASPGGSKPVELTEKQFEVMSRSLKHFADTQGQGRMP